MMDEMDRSAFWWMNVPGPHSAVLEAADALAGNHSVLLKVPPDTAWSETMRGVLEETYKSRTGAYDMSLTRVNAADCAPGTDPGRFLLNRYGSPADVKQYRPGARGTVQEYLAEHGVLAHRLIWVYNINEENAEAWTKFVRGYGGAGPKNGLFVLEDMTDAGKAEGQRLRRVDLRDMISRGDVQLFVHFVLGTAGASGDAWTDYAAAVAARLCGTDAQLAAWLATDPSLRTHGALHVLQELAVDYTGEIAGIGKDHPLHLLREGDIEALVHRIWAAQVQTLFPVIELERLALVREWEQLIQDALDAHPLERFGVRITEAGDADLGALVHMMGTRDLDGMYALYLPDENVRDRIMFLYQCRNRLAHADICAPADVEKLLLPAA